MTYSSLNATQVCIDGTEFRKFVDEKYPEYFVYVSYCGKVYDPGNNTYMPPIDNGNGYKSFNKWIKSVQASRSNYFHRTVAKVWLPNPEGNPTVNHKDCDKSNNHADNLEWSTPSEQTRHGIKQGRINRKGRGWEAVTVEDATKIAQGLFLGKGTMEISRAIGKTRGTVNSVKKSKRNGTLISKLLEQYQKDGLPDDYEW